MRTRGILNPRCSLSLNNPPLENLIVELITTAVRKAAEKASWCWHACGLDAELRALEREAGKTAADAATALSDRVHDEAQHVKLCLKFSR